MQAILEFSYELVAKSPEERNYFFSLLLEWGAPSSLVSSSYTLPSPSLPAALNMLCAIMLILH